MNTKAMLVVALVFIGGCVAQALPSDQPRPAAPEVAVAIIIAPPDMSDAPDMTPPPAPAPDPGNGSPEPMPPPLDCGYAIGGGCCPDGTCAIGICDATNHCK